MSEIFKFSRKTILAIIEAITGVVKFNTTARDKGNLRMLEREKSKLKVILFPKIKADKTMRIPSIIQN